MLKLITGICTAIFVAGSSLAYAQDSSDHRRLSLSDLNALTDARIAVVKAALQLTPEQQKYWPAVEEAIRARAAARQVRLATLPERLSELRDGDPAEVLRERADALAQRAAGLKKLADAWQPLYQTLDPDQKRRLRFLAVRVLHVLQGAAERRRMQMQDEDDDED
jgi:hypothetical protein